MKIVRKFICIFMIILILLSPASFAEEAINSANTTSITTESAVEDEVGVEDQVNLYAESAILIECSTGRTAYEKNADEQMYPASITKVLTAILTIENCSLTDTVTITKEMVSRVPTGYTTAYLRVGERVSVEQLLNALLIPSANDAGFALAIYISGSIEAFSNLMNEKALEIGCTSSHFTNPSGIHDSNHYSTARDMALIALYATKYPEIVEIGCKTSYTLSPPNSNSRTFETTNTLIKPNSNSYYEYATGLKTGFTDPAGACIIATAKKDNMEFIAVILKAPSPQKNIVYRDADCKALFEYGFENYEEIVKVDEPEPELEQSIANFMENTTGKKINLSIILKILVALIGIYILGMIIGRHSKKKRYNSRKVNIRKK